ncbi:AMP-binding protein [Paractinoplanes ferrugineus]|uniref:AMP-dependent ligase n=1 Tax=Paractinoplanes ferrugineus TaxID=113564 RepID=A0A919J617_9ACTN|nr:class I adenylate-forming enzyme family protein [Actinoplanes ferrugineus]GIE13254.1 AMP-dependent ligase [Actinoplanes ferrugineus]
MTGPLVPDLLDDAARRWPGAAAISDGSRRLSYAELENLSRIAAGRLHRSGVRPGDRVVLRLPGDVNFAALLFGALRLGAAVVPMNPALNPYLLEWIVEDAAPALLVTGTDDVPVMRGRSRPPVLCLPPGEQLSGAAVADADLPRPASSGVALLMYTSGSTAMPRAVVSRHDQIRFVVAAIAARLRYTAEDVVFNRSPVSFDYGLYQLFLCARAGARLETRPGLAEVRLLSEIRATGTTVLPIVPTVAEILLRLSARDTRPTSVRMITNTGAALTGGLAAGLRKTFPRAAVVPMYGMTECKRITVAEPDEDLDHPGTVGRPLDGTEVTVVDDEGQPVPAGTVGEIWVRGPHVMAGYWDRAALAARPFAGASPADPVLRTGDYGHVDRDGRLYFAGRRDDIFKRKGVRTSVQEIEAAALDVPGVRAAAVRRPNDDGEFVVWVAGQVEPEQVLAGVLARLERAKMPDRCVVLPELPTTPNGKVDKAGLAGRQSVR